MFSLRYIATFASVLALTCVVQAEESVSSQATAEKNRASFIDPTRPPGKVVSAAAIKQKQKLQSILYSTTSSRSLAIINGKTYAVGDRSPLGVIERIDRDSVSVRGATRRIVTLQRDLNKQTVAGK